MVTDFASIPVVVLCGGMGIYIDDTGTRVNKGLVEVAGEPMVAHVMRSYVRHGFRMFCLACGYQGDQLRKALYARYQGTQERNEANVIRILIDGAHCSIRFVYGQDRSTTGDRLRACREFTQGHGWFCATYSDTLSDIDLSKMSQFHHGHGRLATLLGAQHPSRFRILGVRMGESEVRGFAPRPVLGAEFINGGFYFFNTKIFDDEFLNCAGHGVILEDAIFDRLVAANQLMAYFHKGAWQNLDAERDLLALERIARER